MEVASRQINQRRQISPEEKGKRLFDGAFKKAPIRLIRGIDQ
jgi:hypothetical protein